MRTAVKQYCRVRPYGQLGGFWRNRLVEQLFSRRLSAFNLIADGPYLIPEHDFSYVPILLQKSFALVTEISFGCTRDFRVKMRGTSSPDDKLTGDLRNAIEGARISGRRSDFFTAGKLALGYF